MRSLERKNDRRKPCFVLPRHLAGCPESKSKTCGRSRWFRTRKGVCARRVLFWSRDSQTPTNVTTHRMHLKLVLSATIETTGQMSYEKSYTPHSHLVIVFNSNFKQPTSSIYASWIQKMCGMQLCLENRTASSV